MAGGALLFPDTSASHPPLAPVASAVGAGGASASGAPLSPVAVGGPLSAVSGRPLSLVASVGLLSTVLGHFLSSVTSGGPLSAVLVRPLSLVPPASSRVLFLTSTPSRTNRSFLPFSPFFQSFSSSSPTPLARNPEQLTEKRLFDQAFIAQRLIASTQQNEELDSSFE